MLKRMEVLIILEIFLFLAIISRGLTEPVEDKQALLDFFHNISHSHSLNWNESSLVCDTWTGVFCNADQSRVIALRLPGTRLRGRIPENTLSRLTELQILSLRLNGISGLLPSDFSKLEKLNSLFLQFNRFSGPLVLDFSAFKNLSFLDLSNNFLNGSIPSSIWMLSNLTVLNLANNSLSGEIPDIDLPNLQWLDLSNNNLTGDVPRSLRRFPRWAFAGNNLTIKNDAFPPAFPPAFPLLPPSSQPARKGKRLDESAKLAIAIGGGVVVFILIAVLIIICWLRRRRENQNSTMVPRKKETPVKKWGSESQDHNNSLNFFQDSSLAFDLEELLSASAEVLGKGTFGVSYKASLEDTATIAVKRLNQVMVGKREFEQQMELIGNVKHENVVPLRAYYYSKDEKLMVYDYYSHGSVSSMLHNKQGGRHGLDWETRMRIAIGVARGLAHIHTENGGKFCHGNIKASNTFLNSKGYGCVSDFGLAMLMNSIPLPAAKRTPGYRAPEVIDSRRASEAADVYSFGVLLLELLTGKSPVHVEGSNEVVNLVRWVNSVVREEWTAEVFDMELLRYPNIEEEMVEMLQIGLSCVAKMPETRPKMIELVSRIEQVRQLSSENQASSESKSEHSTPTRVAVTEIGSSSSYLH